MHARRIELHYPFFVGQPAKPHTLIIRVKLLNVHPGDHRIERVLAPHNLVVRHRHPANPV